MPLPPILPSFTLNLITVTVYYKLPNSQINQLKQIQNSPAFAIITSPKSSHITPTLQSVNQLKINA